MQKKLLHSKLISTTVILLFFGIAVSPSFNVIKVTISINNLLGNNSKEESESLFNNKSLESTDIKYLNDNYDCCNNSQDKWYPEKICKSLLTILYLIEMYLLFMSLLLHNTEFWDEYIEKIYDPLMNLHQRLYNIFELLNCPLEYKIKSNNIIYKIFNNDFNSIIDQISNKYFKSNKDYNTLINKIDYNKEDDYPFFICLNLWLTALAMFIPYVYVIALHEKGYITEKLRNLLLSVIIYIQDMIYRTIVTLNCPSIFPNNIFCSSLSIINFSIKNIDSKNIYRLHAIK